MFENGVCSEVINESEEIRNGSIRWENEVVRSYRKEDEKKRMVENDVCSDVMAVKR